MKTKTLLRISTIIMSFLLLAVLMTNSKILAAEKKSISIESAAKILSVSIDDLQTSISDMMISPEDLKKKIYKIHPYSCSIRSKSNFLKSITYYTYVYKDSELALKEYKKMEQGYKIVAKVEMVPEIGDKTFLVNDKRFQRMVAIKKNVVIDVLSPKETNLQKQVLNLVLMPY